MPLPAHLVLALSELASLACLVLLWRRRAGVARRLAWSVVVFLPLLGPLFYGAFFEVPPVQPEIDRARQSDTW